MSTDLSTQNHNIPPVFDKDSRVLVLGSFPSVMSRKQEFFYGHPRNRFWRIIALICSEQTPNDINRKKQLLLSHGIAVWDVIKSCDIRGSSDTSITNVIPNDISVILESCDIQMIFCNGTRSFELYERFIYPKTKIKAVKLPSTSPANAAFNEKKLFDSWKILKEYIK